MTVLGTPGRLVSWAKRCPQTRQSGKKTSSGKAGKGNPWLNGILGEIAASASRTDTFLGERYRRLARRRGKRKAMVAISRSILVIIFCLLSDRSARFCDLGPDFLRHPAQPRPQDPQPYPPAPGPRDQPRRPRRAYDQEPARSLTGTTPADPAARPGRGPLPPACRGLTFPVSLG